MKSFLSLGLVALLSTSAFAAYKKIAADDAGAHLAADFAVKKEAEKTKKELKLDEVVSATSEAGKGSARKYRLCLKVSGDKKEPATVKAQVSVDQYENEKLLAWTYTSCK